MVTKEKWKLKNVIGMDETYELKQLFTYDMQLLKYNPIRNNVENIYNIYLQHHLIKVNI